MRVAWSDRGGPRGEEGWFGHPQFTAGSPHFQDPFTTIIATESPLWQRIVHLPPKNLALARLHPPRVDSGKRRDAVDPVMGQGPPRMKMGSAGRKGE